MKGILLLFAIVGIAVIVGGGIWLYSWVSTKAVRKHRQASRLNDIVGVYEIALNEIKQDQWTSPETMRRIELAEIDVRNLRTSGNRMVPIERRRSIT